jgi:hypothetical protein
VPRLTSCITAVGCNGRHVRLSGLSDTLLEAKAFKAMADLYLDADVRESYESRLGKLHQKFEKLLVRIQLPEFRKRFPLVVRWDAFPRMGVFGAAKDWIDAEEEGKAVISFSVFCSPPALERTRVYALRV